jgi:SAM-dependent methyltransferase
MKEEGRRPRMLGPLPSRDLRARVTGSSSASWFTKSGVATIKEWRRALALADCRFSDFGTILDFGCGCGRTIRHLQTDLLPTQRLLGFDVDAEAIAWLAATYPRVNAVALNGAPPTPLTAGSVDLVVSHSVFTHLPEGLQLQWLEELARLLRIDGILVTSVHGTKVIREYRETLAAQNRNDEARRFEEAIRGKGFYYVQGRAAAEMALPEYYGAAFHDIRYLLQHWLQAFTLIAWLPTFALGHQDVLVLRRKAELAA